jgi:hypothetical protein
MLGSLRWSALAVAAAVCATPLQAQVYFGLDNTGSASSRAALVNSTAAQSNFLAQLSGVGTESFESFPLLTAAPLELSFAGAGTATLSGSGCVSNISRSACSNSQNASTPGGTNGFGRYPISGTNYYEVDAGNFRIDFSGQVAAFGFFGVDIGEFGGTLALRFFNGASVLLEQDVAIAQGDGSAFYFGYINAANPFTAVEFVRGGSGGDVFAFDDMTIGSRQQVVGVPEPSSLALLLVGLGGMLVAFRRRVIEN